MVENEVVAVYRRSVGQKAGVLCWGVFTKRTAAAGLIHCHFRSSVVDYDDSSEDDKVVECSKIRACCRK